MKILLTGHKGYIGAVAGPILSAAGHEVVGLDTDLYASCDFGDATSDIPEIRKDLRDLTRADLEGFDAVVHLAALSNDPVGNLNPQLTYDINHLASVKLGESSRKQAGVARLFSRLRAARTARRATISSTRPPHSIRSLPTASPRSWSSATSRRWPATVLAPTYMRNATAYGASPRLRLDIVLNDLVASAFTTGRVYIKSDGTPWRPIVHIRDIIAASRRRARCAAGSVHNQTFNVGRNDENFRIRELADIVAEIVPGCRVEYAPGGGPDIGAIASTSTRSTGWSQRSVRSGLRAKAPRNSTTRIAASDSRPRIWSRALRPHQRNSSSTAGGPAGQLPALDRQDRQRPR